MLRTVVGVSSLTFFLFVVHLGLELSAHLVALASEARGLLTLFGGPVANVALDLSSPLGIGHTNHLTLHAHADLVVGVDKGSRRGDGAGAGHLAGCL